ncbi:MAG: hypothetical protein NT116_03065 [Candidatus Parcubacteria bacterium]|nr:hypothetical protein [Candidatus Parcubacteria bacterium]
MNRGFIKKVFLQLSVGLFFLLLPLLSKAQVCAPGASDALLKEYLFPISSYAETGNSISKFGLECEGAGALSGAYQTCSSLLGDTGNIVKASDGKSVKTYDQARFSYKLSVPRQDNYIFKISVSNDADNFSRLTRQQIDYLLSSMDIETQLSLIGEGITEDDLALIATKDEERYQLYRSIVFSVYVDCEPDGTNTCEKKGFIFVKNTDPNAMQEGSLKIGNLTPGDHTINLHYLSDNYYDFYNAWNTGTCANTNGEPCQMSDATSCAIPATCATTETLPSGSGMSTGGTSTVEVCSGGKKNGQACATDADCASRTSIEPLLIDGYKAIRDERTIYVNAANLKETVKDNVIYKSFFTNIYVMAYNQAATPSTIAIFNQMLNNWKFNTNITSEEIREKLRRDMSRMLDLAQINNLLKEYYSIHGKYPVLDAGTLLQYLSVAI